jgi:two-component system, OmpR family, sensor histidine kinase BaeS
MARQRPWVTAAGVVAWAEACCGGWGLRSKLFVALLVTAVLAVGATGTAARFAFLRGFLGYLNDQEASSARKLVPLLVAQYERYGGWSHLNEDPRVWFGIILRADFGGTFTPRVPFPPTPFGTVPPGFNPTPGSVQPASMPGLGMRLALLDAKRRFIIGNPIVGSYNNDVTKEPITLGDKVIGWLVVLPFNRLTAGAAGAFQREQLLSSWAIGVVAVGLAALAAAMLTRRILQPIRKIGDATHRLAAGNYTVRLEVSSSDEIARLAADFNRMALALERNEAMRRTFLADVSHELRTPISILRAELEAIEDEVHELTAESLRSWQGEVATLGKLIDDLYDLSLADIGALTYRMSSVDLVRFLRGRLLAFQDRYAQRRISIESRLPENRLAISADEMRLNQLINNLLENSLRYTDPGGRLSVVCRVEHEMAVIDLQDTAPGVPEEFLCRLFERFYRGDPSRNRASGGAGLGLAIAKRIVEAHAGTILARQSPLGGLWIRVALPMAG